MRYGDIPCSEQGDKEFHQNGFAILIRNRQTIVVSNGGNEMTRFQSEKPLGPGDQITLVKHRGSSDYTLEINGAAMISIIHSFRDVA